MNVLSLFSGIGGLDLGLERAGMTIVGQVEIDPWCRKVLAKHWPEVPRHDDVRTAAGWWGIRTAPDLVAGGFPCQPVSLAGKGLAQADSRWLWPAFAGVIRHLRPRYVLMENVPGLLGRGMGDVLGDLAALGYDAEWDCVPAAFVGAPHIRNRVWIVAYPAGIGRLGADHDQREHLAPRRAGRPAAQDNGLAGQAGSKPRVLADAASPRRASRQPGESQQVRDAARRPEPERRSRYSDHWAAEPAVGRVADGVPHRLDRLRGLGNAVVPQVAEHVGRLIMTAAQRDDPEVGVLARLLTNPPPPDREPQ